MGSGSNSAWLDKPGAQLLWVKVLAYLAPGMSPGLACARLPTYRDETLPQAVILPSGNTLGADLGSGTRWGQDLSLPEVETCRGTGPRRGTLGTEVGSP